MRDTYIHMFGTAPKEFSSPFETNDHPELDVSDDLDEDGIKKSQIVLQWGV